MLIILATIVFIAGYVIYWIGFNVSEYEEGYNGLRDSMIAHYILPAISSLEMFVLQSDIQIIGNEYQDNGWYMLFFVLTHVSAACISCIVALNYIGVKFYSWIRWNWIRFCTSKYIRLKEMPEVHIFFDINSASRLLASDIRKTKGHEKDLIVFVDCQQQNDRNRPLSIATIFNLYSARKELLQMARDMGAILKRIYTPIYDISDNNVCSILNIEWAIRRGSRCKFYFFNEKENENIMAAIKIQEDKIYSTEEIDKMKVKLYCLASRESVNRFFEYNPKNGIEIELIDSSFLSITELKANVKYQPVSYITYDPETALATSPFHAMIVGFGETGQEAFKFLYEFGQFIYDNNSDASEFHCSIFDCNLQQIKPRFEIRYPAIRNNWKLFSWHQCNYKDNLFWDEVKRIIDDLNYVVISTGNDDDNIALAVDLYEYALLHRKNGLHQFAIFVRIYCANKEAHLEFIRRYTEEGKIYLFGKIEDLYQVKCIWRHEQEKEAKVFYTEYAQLEAYYKEKGEYTTWEERHQYAVDSGDTAKYRDVLRKESQDLSNTYHKFTKRLLGVKLRINEINKEEFKKQLTSEEIVTDAYKGKSLPYINLSRLEHKRWNAAHEMMGYETMTVDEFEAQEADENGYIPSCQVLKKKHVCLVDWNEIPKLPLKYDVRPYDTLVVLTSLQKQTLE